MRRIVVTVVLLLACVCLFGVLGVVLAIEVSRPPVKEVAVRIGDDWNTIRSASSYQFPGQVDPTGHSVQRVVDFRYTDPDLGFEVDHVKTVWFTMKEGKVDWVYILVSPEAQDWDSAQELVLGLGKMLDSAGWPPERKNDPERARSYYNSELPMMGTYAVGLWSTTDRYAEIQIYRLSDGPETGKPKELPERFSVSMRVGTKSTN